MFTFSLQLPCCDLILNEGFFLIFIVTFRGSFKEEIVFKINNIGLNELLCFDIEANLLLGL